VTCPFCSTPTVPGARYCHHCGAPLSPEASAPQTERRYVTVLFCDLSDFTTWSESLDPERVSSVTDRLLAECVEAGARGVVNKDAPFDRLLADVQRAAVRGRLLSEHDRQETLALLRRHRAQEHDRMAPFRRLTAREAHVLAALLDGHPAERIAQDAFVSITTVRSQIRGLLTKLEVSSQLAAVALAATTTLTVVAIALFNRNE
jgi:DNA-binding CsgD family transcriptional regulator